MSRWKAAGIHLSISLLIAALVGSVIYFVWYPPPYFTVAGGNKLMLLIMGVDIVIGPLLTLAVYKAGKRGLKFDLTVIALLQASAFCYGLTVIAASRPIFVVLAAQRFMPVYANELDDAELAKAKSEFSKRSWTGPYLVGAQLPTDAKERADLLVSGVAGKDIDKYPKYYVPYAEVADEALARGKPLTALGSRSNELKTAIDAFVALRKLDPNKLVYLPLIGRTRVYTVVLSTDTKRPIGVLDIDPPE